MSVDLEDVLAAIAECYRDVTPQHVWGDDPAITVEDLIKYREDCAAFNRVVRHVAQHVHRRFLDQ